MAEATKKVWDLTGILEAKKPVTAEVPLVIDPAYGEQLAEARRDLNRAELGARQARTDDARVEAEVRVEEAQAALDELHEARDGKVIDFEFHGLNPLEYDEIVEAHVPTAQQRSKANKNGQTLQWNPDTFPAGLIAATMTYPKLDEEEIAQLMGSDQFNQAEIEALFAAAMKACTTAYRDVG